MLAELRRRSTLGMAKFCARRSAVRRGATSKGQSMMVMGRWATLGFTVLALVLGALIEALHHAAWPSTPDTGQSHQRVSHTGSPVGPDASLACAKVA
jgi:hypothetical protein